MEEQGQDRQDATPKPLSVEQLLVELTTGELPDWWLRMWVGIVNQSSTDTSIGITLMVDGALVTGDLVGGRAYFNGLAAHIRATGTGNGVDAVANAMEMGAERYPERTLDDDEDDEDEAVGSSTGYIHLRNARIFSPGGSTVSGEGVWWRGRLASVDAFWFGTVGFGA